MIAAITGPGLIAANAGNDAAGIAAGKVDLAAAGRLIVVREA